MGKEKVKSKSVMTREELISYLETVLTGLKQGALILDNEERPMILRPSDAIEAEVEVKQKADKEKVELKLCWTPNRMQTLVAAHPDAAILSSDPAGEEAKKK